MDTWTELLVTYVRAEEACDAFWEAEPQGGYSIQYIDTVGEPLIEAHNKATEALFRTDAPTLSALRDKLEVFQRLAPFDGLVVAPEWYLCILDDATRLCPRLLGVDA